MSVGANCVRPKTTLSEIGKLVNENIGILNDTYETVEANKYVIMPNHIHFIAATQMGECKAGEHSSPLRYHTL